jgi:hypothetical protein
MGAATDSSGWLLTADDAVVLAWHTNQAYSGLKVRSSSGISGSGSSSNAQMVVQPAVQHVV